MKKLLLASLLSLAFTGTSNAALVTIDRSISLPGEADLSVGSAFGTNGSTKYWEINVVGQGSPTTFSFLTAFPLTASIKWDVFKDVNTTIGIADTGATLASGTISLASPTAFFAFDPGSYVLKFSTNGVIAAGHVTGVPVPAAAWLFGSALFGAGALRRKQKSA